MSNPEVLQEPRGLELRFDGEVLTYSAAGQIISVRAVPDEMAIALEIPAEHLIQLEPERVELADRISNEAAAELGIAAPPLRWFLILALRLLGPWPLGDAHRWVDERVPRPPGQMPLGQYEPGGPIWLDARLGGERLVLAVAEEVAHHEQWLRLDGTGRDPDREARETEAHAFARDFAARFRAS